MAELNPVARLAKKAGLGYEQACELIAIDRELSKLPKKKTATVYFNLKGPVAKLVRRWHKILQVSYGAILSGAFYRTLRSRKLNNG